MKRSLFFSARARRLVLACSLCLVSTSHSTAVEFHLSQVSELGPGEADLYPAMLTELDGSLYFEAAPNGEYQNRGLYRSDGEQIMRLAGMTKPLRGGALPTLDGYVYFPMPGPDGDELARTNGQTVMQVADINPGPAGSSPEDFHNLAGQLIFTASGPDGRALYKTDGTRATQLADIHPEVDFVPFANFTEFAGELYFEATGPAGRELFRTDGERALQVTDINPGSGDSIEPGARRVVLRDEMYFVANRTSGGQLYSN